MIESELHPYIELVAREARRSVSTGAGARARIMAAVRLEPRPGQRPTLWRRVIEPRALRLSPATGALLAAGLVGLGVLTGRLATHPIDRDGHVLAGQSAVAAPGLPVSDTLVLFAFYAPRANQVSLVGDFNGWDDSKLPMVRSSNNGSNNGFWTVTLPLSAGRHLYQFVVDGVWLPDPHAPIAGDDGFGRVNSVKLVQKGSAL